MTRLGVILGTAAYMSPEQARAKPSTQRSDVWAFGCVLYEMLTGEQLFRGETITDVLAAVVNTRAGPEQGVAARATAASGVPREGQPGIGCRPSATRGCSSTVARRRVQRVHACHGVRC